MIKCKNILLCGAYYVNNEFVNRLITEIMKTFLNVILKKKLYLNNFESGRQSNSGEATENNEFELLLL